MGVTYKLKEEVLAFILQRKADHPKISCQDISDEILSQFDVKVSKSSVHEALKHAGVIKPRERKVKDTFEIPSTAKVKIQEEIAKAAADLLPANPLPPPDVPVTLIPDVMTKEEVPLQVMEEPKEAVPLLQRSAPIMQAGEIVLKALLSQMGLATQEEYEKQRHDAYFTFLIDAYRLDFSDAPSLYLDAQATAISEDINALTTCPRFLPGAIIWACDCFVNGIKPVKVLSSAEPLLIARLEQLLDNPASLVKVALLTINGQQITAFECLKRQRQVIKTEQITPTAFINTKDKTAATLVSLAYQVFGQGLSEEKFAYLINAEGFTIKTPQNNTLNLIVADNGQDGPMLDTMCASLTSLSVNYNGLDNIIVKAISPSDV